MALSRYMTTTQSKPIYIYMTAILLAFPNGTLIWFLIMYPAIGTTGDMMHPFAHALTYSVSTLIVFVWAIYGSEKISEVVYRSCRFGILLALLLPVITGLMSLCWAIGLIDRPPGFLPGFSGLEIPVHAATAGLVLIALFLTGSFFAAKKMDGIPF